MMPSVHAPSSTRRTARTRPAVRRRWAGAAAGVAAAVVLLTSGCSTDPMSADPEHRSFKLPGKTLDVRSDFNTDLVATDRSDIKVTRWFNHEYGTNPKTSWSLKGNSLQLEAGCSGIAFCEAKFRVEVPKGTRVLRNGHATDLR